MKTTRILFVFALATIFLLTACGGTTPPEPAPLLEPSPVVEPATPVESAPVEPTQAVEPAAPEPTQPQYAPFCDAAPAGCEAPAIEVRDKAMCIEKVPYVVMSAPEETTFESQDPDMECVEQDGANGKFITCHSVTSKQLWSYDLKVCNGACSAPALQMGTGQCQEGYGYDAANACCAAPAPSGGDGCTIFQVDLGACP